MAELAALKITGEADFSKAEQAFNSYAAAVEKATQSISQSMGNIGKVVQMPNIGDISKAFQQANDEVKTSTKSISDAARQMYESVSNSSVAESSLDKLGAKIQDLKTQLNSVKGALKISVEAGDSGTSGALIRQQTQLQQELRQTTTLLNRQIKENESLEGSYDQLSARLYQLKQAYHALSAEEKSAASGESLKANINDITDKLKVSDAEIGVYTRHVGNYERSWNGLGNAINQLTREMPNFTMSINTGFMAISNNLPILADEISRIRTENKALAAEGKPTTSVLKQLGTAFFSWNTAISVGITLLTAYGPKLYDWITGAGDAKKRAEELKKANDELNQSYQGSLESSAKDVSKLRELVAISTDVHQSYNTRIAAIKELKKEYPDLLSKYSTEEMLQSSFANTINAKVIPALMAAAKAKALFAKVDTRASNELKLQDDLRNALLKRNKAYQDVVREGRIADSGAGLGATAMAASAEKRLKAAQEDVNGILSQIKANYVSQKKETAQALAEIQKAGDAGARAFRSPETPKKKKTKLTDAQKDAKEALEIEKRYIADYNDLQKDFTGGFTDEKGLNQGIFNAAENARKALNRLNVPDSDTFVVRLIGDEKAAQTAINRINFEEYTKKLTDKFNNSLYDFNKKLSSDLDKQATERFAVPVEVNFTEDQKEVKYLREWFKNQGIDSFQIEPRMSPTAIKEIRSNLEDAKKAYISSLDDQIRNTQRFISGPVDTLINGLGKGENIIKSLGSSFKDLGLQIAAAAAKAAILAAIFGDTQRGQEKGGFSGIFNDIFGQSLGITTRKESAYNFSGAQIKDSNNTQKAEAPTTLPVDLIKGIPVLSNDTGKSNQALDATTGFLNVAKSIANKANVPESASGDSGLSTALGMAGTFASLVPGGAPFGIAASLLSKFKFFADGGIVSGPTAAIVGEYAGAANNPEVIAPLSDLQQYIGTSAGAQVIIPDTRIDGNDIVISYNRTQNIKNR